MSDVRAYYRAVERERGRLLRIIIQLPRSQLWQ